MKRKCCVLFFLVLFASSLIPGFALGDPFDTESEQRVQEESHDGNVGVWLASFFRKHISAVDGDRCPSEPTCSSYSVQAFKKHGLVMGWMMTVDRLIHEGDEWQVSPVKTRNGKGKIIDPLKNNDFWWYENKRHDKVSSSQK